MGLTQISIGFNGTLASTLPTCSILGKPPVCWAYQGLAWPFSSRSIAASRCASLLMPPADCRTNLRFMCRACIGFRASFGSFMSPGRQEVMFHFDWLLRLKGKPVQQDSYLSRPLADAHGHCMPVLAHLADDMMSTRKQPVLSLFVPPQVDFRDDLRSRSDACNPTVCLHIPAQTYSDSFVTKASIHMSSCSGR